MLALLGLGGTALAQVGLPEIAVTSSREKPKPRPVAHPAASAPVVAPLTPAEQALAKNNAFDQSRSNLYTTIGTTSSTQTHATIDALPQGTNQSVEKVLLQAPGVSQDSVASGFLHVRNDHANVQYRINGVMLPDGIGGFGSVLSTSWVGSIALVTGALPAEFGLRTIGLVDITTRADVFNNSGSVGFYGGSRGTITPTFEYGGTFGGNCPATSSSTVTKAPSSWSSKDCFSGVQYYFTGRYLQTTEGIENPTPMLNAIHDFSHQASGFAYMSTFVDPATRLSLIAGTSYNTFQIPNTPRPAGRDEWQSSRHQCVRRHEFQFGAAQREPEGVQPIRRTGSATVHARLRRADFLFHPLQQSALHPGPDRRPAVQRHRLGCQPAILHQRHSGRCLVCGQRGAYAARRLHRQRRKGLGRQYVAGRGLRSGLRRHRQRATPPFSITDDVAKLAWLAGVYVQDEWKITSQLTMNAGLRFDQMWQFTNANQLSPRLSFTYKPFENTTFHAGYARYFTPPVLVEAAPANIALFNNTTGAPNAGQANDPVLPERSHYFDAGVVQKIPFGCYGPASHDCANLEVGLDAYYKIAKDLIDNGQFGQALVLSAFNYQKGINEGIELSMKYTNGHFQAYANLAVAQQKSHQRGVEPISVRQHDAARHSRRPDRVPVHCDALDLHRPQPVRHRFGRRDLPVLRPSGHGSGNVRRGRHVADLQFMVRHAALRRHDLRQRIAARRRQYRAVAAVQPRSMSASRANSCCPATPSRSRCASTSSTCSTRSIRSGAAAASACSRRNTVRVAVITGESRRSSEAANRSRKCCMRG